MAKGLRIWKKITPIKRSLLPYISNDKGFELCTFFYQEVQPKRQGPRKRQTVAGLNFALIEFESWIFYFSSLSQINPW